MACVFWEPGKWHVETIVEDQGIDRVKAGNIVGQLLRCRMVERRDTGRLYATHYGVWYARSVLELKGQEYRMRGLLDLHVWEAAMNGAEPKDISKLVGCSSGAAYQALERLKHWHRVMS